MQVTAVAVGTIVMVVLFAKFWIYVGRLVSNHVNPEWDDGIEEVPLSLPPQVYPAGPSIPHLWR